MPAQMAVTSLARRASVDPSRSREVANRLEEAIDRRSTGGAPGDHRLVDEAAERGFDVSFCHTGDGPGRLQVELAFEDGEIDQDIALDVVEEVEAPRNRGFERPLARHGRATAAGEEPEAFVQAVGDHRERHRPGPGGGELERKRDAVEA